MWRFAAASLARRMARAVLPSKRLPRRRFSRFMGLEGCTVGEGGGDVSRLAKAVHKPAPVRADGCVVVILPLAVFVVVTLEFWISLPKIIPEVVFCRDAELAAAVHGTGGGVSGAEGADQPRRVDEGRGLQAIAFGFFGLSHWFLVRFDVGSYIQYRKNLSMLISIMARFWQESGAEGNFRAAPC